MNRYERLKQYLLSSMWPPGYNRECYLILKGPSYENKDCINTFGIARAPSYCKKTELIGRIFCGKRSSTEKGAEVLGNLRSTTNVEIHLGTPRTLLKTARVILLEFLNSNVLRACRICKFSILFSDSHFYSSFHTSNLRPKGGAKFIYYNT